LNEEMLCGLTVCFSGHDFFLLGHDFFSYLAVLGFSSHRLISMLYMAALLDNGNIYVRISTWIAWQSKASMV